MTIDIKRLLEITSGEILDDCGRALIRHGATTVDIRPDGTAIYNDVARTEFKQVNQAEAEALVKGGTF